MKDVPSAEALESVHKFPCQYTIKVFGENSTAFLESVQKKVSGLLDTNEYLQITERPSSKGKHLALSLKLYVQSAQKVQLLYIELKNLEGIRFIL